MRYVETLPEAQAVPQSDTALAGLANWVYEEVEDALQARMPLEQEWLQCLRMYESKPKNKRRDIPIENAPNIEVPIGAIAADNIYAQATDLINNVSPPITVRATSAPWVKHAQALQVYVNWMSEQELQMRGRGSGGGPSDHAMLDDIQLGTGIFHIPFEEWKTKRRSDQVLWASPRCYAIPIEDFLVPPGLVPSLQTARFCGYRMYLTREELQGMTEIGWDVELAEPVGTLNMVRQARERVGRSLTSQRGRTLYEPWKLYCHYDIDGDGVPEDLQVGWDHTARKLLGVRWNPYDHRPFAAMQYQIRTHMFYGLGVLAMLSSFQEEATELHNYRTLNLMLANARVWVGKRGNVPTSMKMWPNKIVPVPNPREDFQALQMADVYPSAFEAESVTLSLAERRVGMNDLNTPRPANIVGSRTPGITALSMLNQALRRFAPAFDGIRLAHAEVIRQALYRLQERILAGGMPALDVKSNIMRVMGFRDGGLIVSLLEDDHFDEAVAIELTASSVTVNREADRQNAILLANIMTQYYERLLQLAVIVANPQMPKELREVALRVSTAAGELADRTVRSFDQVRDPETLVVNLTEVFRGLDARAPGGFGGLGQLLGQYLGTLSGGGAGNGNGAQGGLALPGAGEAG